MANWLRFTLYSIFGATLFLLGLAAYKSPAARNETPQVPIALMIEQLDDDNALVRGWAVRALSPLVDENATVDAAIAKMLSDPDPKVRAMAANVLGISTGELFDEPVDGLPALPIPAPDITESSAERADEPTRLTDLLKGDDAGDASDTDLARSEDVDATQGQVASETPAPVKPSTTNTAENTADVPTDSLTTSPDQANNVAELPNADSGTEQDTAAIITDTDSPTSTQTPTTDGSPPEAERIATANQAADAGSEGATSALSYMRWLLFGLAALLGLWLLSIFVVALVAHFAPLTILRWDHNLRNNRFLANILLIGPLAKSLKILKAWVADVAPLLKERLTALPVMASAESTLEVPIMLAGSQRDALRPDDLKGIFADPTHRKGAGALSVTGAPGTGSSTCARQIISWIMQSPETFTKSGDTMLAVLLDEDVHLRNRQTHDGTIQAITEQLSRLLDHDAQVSPRHVQNLLNNHLLLVALDRQSVASSRAPTDPDHSVVIFNRPPGKLPANTPVLNALPLEGSDLDSFMDRYFADQGQPEGLSPSQRSRAHKDLAKIAGTTVPVQIATLYADRLLASMQHHFRSRANDNLALLITDTVKVRNLQQSGPELPEAPLLDAAKSLAWASFERDLRHTWITTPEGRKAVAGEDPRRYMQHLDHGLQITEVCHPDYETVGLRFRSSLMATYLAAWKVAESCKNNLQAWEPLMNRLIDLDAADRPMGFLRALDNVFTASAEDWTTPYEVRKTISDMLDDAGPAIAPLNIPKREDAATQPASTVVLDSPLVDELSPAPKTPDEASTSVRNGLAGAATAAAALTVARSAGTSSKDEGTDETIDATDNITYLAPQTDSPAPVDAPDDGLISDDDWLAGEPAPEVIDDIDGVVVSAVEDADQGVAEDADDFRQFMRATDLDPASLNSYVAKGALAVPALINFMKRGDSDTRRLAAKGLAAIGPEARDAIPVLADALKDEDSAVRTSAAEALYHLGTPDSSSSSGQAS